MILANCGDHVEVGMTSPIDGTYNTMKIPMTSMEFQIALDNWKQDGMLLQDAFPSLTPEQREFIKTGITPKQWDAMLGAN